MVDTVAVDELANDMIAGMGEYVPAQPPEAEIPLPRADAPPDELRPALDPEAESPPTAPAGQVVLVNLEYVHETIFLPDASGKEVSGATVKFQDGHLITDAETAAYVQGQCPYVYVEPSEGPVFGPHPETGFRTRSATGWARYNVLLAQNR